ncbi:PREDICTED: E3 ubiquitin-protein ligase RNF181 homolog [Eufriesea mexicana]|uniref:E3 ubiquitin-protein ligase RNF181 homolog n=1 Tax=Eufriesea mexicana TaxID=516756 RepID=UPI00083BA789|nr:PREDICTED: E3 ubiquitin-protein ligase RNF181 homolog [Eufriesea mexicana]
MASPVLVTIFLGLAISTLLYFMFGDYKEENGESSYQYNHEYYSDISSNSEQCVICQEPLPNQPIRILDCSHKFHVLCITAWKEQCTSLKITCPLCRRTFK